MSRMLRWGRWTVVAAAMLLLFWLTATVGGWSPDLRRLTISVHGPLVADYRTDSPERLAPLSPDIVKNANGDQSPGPSPHPPPSASPRPGPSGSTGPSTTPTPSGSILPLPTPTLPIATPTPLPTPSLPVPTPPPVP